jgi:hypothetical protein
VVLVNADGARGVGVECVGRSMELDAGGARGLWVEGGIGGEWWRRGLRALPLEESCTGGGGGGMILARVSS